MGLCPLTKVVRYEISSYQGTKTPFNMFVLLQSFDYVRVVLGQEKRATVTCVGTSLKPLQS